MGYAGGIAVSGCKARAEKWRPQCCRIKYFSKAFRFNRKTNNHNILRFNPIQIAEWMDEVRRTKLVAPCDRAVTLAGEFRLSKSRVLQFLALLRIPVDLRVLLKDIPGLTEGELRRIVRMKPIEQRVAIRRLLGMGMLAKAG